MGRDDIHAFRWENKQGKSGYAVACHNEWQPGLCNKPKIKCSECTNKAYIALGSRSIYDHLSGAQTIGLYPLLADDTCQLLAVDFDKSDWQQAVKAFAQVCNANSIPCAIERSRSGNGAHIWIFFESIVLAKDARRLRFSLLDLAMENYPGLSFDSYDRLFPNQDSISSGGFGNLIALPLQYHPRQDGNSVFVDQELVAYPDQWQFLSGLSQLPIVNYTIYCGNLMMPHWSQQPSHGSKVYQLLKPKLTIARSAWKLYWLIRYTFLSTHYPRSYWPG